MRFIISVFEVWKHLEERGVDPVTPLLLGSAKSGKYLVYSERKPSYSIYPANDAFPGGKRSKEYVVKRFVDFSQGALKDEFSFGGNYVSPTNAHMCISMFVETFNERGEPCQRLVADGTFTIGQLYDTPNFTVELHDSSAGVYEDTRPLKAVLKITAFDKSDIQSVIPVQTAIIVKKPSDLSSIAEHAYTAARQMYHPLFYPDPISLRFERLRLLWVSSALSRRIGASVMSLQKPVERSSEKLLSHILTVAMADFRMEPAQFISAVETQKGRASATLQFHRAASALVHACTLMVTCMPYIGDTWLSGPGVVTGKEQYTWPRILQCGDCEDGALEAMMMAMYEFGVKSDDPLLSAAYFITTCYVPICEVYAASSGAARSEGGTSDLQSPNGISLAAHMAFAMIPRAKFLQMCPPEWKDKFMAVTGVPGQWENNLAPMFGETTGVMDPWLSPIVLSDYETNGKLNAEVIYYMEELILRDLIVKDIPLLKDSDGMLRSQFSPQKYREDVVSMSAPAPKDNISAFKQYAIQFFTPKFVDVIPVTDFAIIDSKSLIMGVHMNAWAMPQSVTPSTLTVKPMLEWTKEQLADAEYIIGAEHPIPRLEHVESTVRSRAVQQQLKDTFYNVPRGDDWGSSCSFSVALYNAGPVFFEQIARLKNLIGKNGITGIRYSVDLLGDGVGRACVRVIGARGQIWKREQ